MIRKVAKSAAASYIYSKIQMPQIAGAPPPTPRIVSGAAVISVKVRESLHGLAAAAPKTTWIFYENFCFFTGTKTANDDTTTIATNDKNGRNIEQVQLLRRKPTTASSITSAN